MRVNVQYSVRMFARRTNDFTIVYSIESNAMKSKRIQSLQWALKWRTLAGEHAIRYVEISAIIGRCFGIVAKRRGKEWKFDRRGIFVVFLLVKNFAQILKLGVFDQLGLFFHNLFGPLMIYQKANAICSRLFLFIRPYDQFHLFFSNDSLVELSRATVPSVLRWIGWSRRMRRYLEESVDSSFQTREARLPLLLTS